MRRIHRSIERRQAVMNGFVWIASRSSLRGTADPPPPSAILFIETKRLQVLDLVELVCHLLRRCYLNTTEEEEQQQQDLPYHARLLPSPCRPRIDLREPSAGVWGSR
jgi:hypothetical protein